MAEFADHIFAILRELSNKIDNLERKIDDLASKTKIGGGAGRGSADTTPSSPDFVPGIEFQPWLNQFVTNREDLDLVFGVSMLDGYKQCISRNIGENPPIWVLSSTKTVSIYIYEDAAWRVASEEDIHCIIDAIWRKMLEFYFILSDEPDISEDEQTRRDINKKNLIDMRKKMVSRHTRDIARFIVGLTVDG